MVIAKTENVHRAVEAIGLGVSAVLSLDTSSDQLLQALRLVTAATPCSSRRAPGTPSAARPTRRRAGRTPPRR